MTMRRMRGMLYVACNVIDRSLPHGHSHVCMGVPDHVLQQHACMLASQAQPAEMQASAAVFSSSSKAVAMAPCGSPHVSVQAALDRRSRPSLMPQSPA
mmetsp:Transcript_21148/g.53744  ORF Transcript_21148/g.53744 Transcript_21148/m.53744 type:complete len:98 (-) Transcript_21148:33-326(-)